MKTLGKLLGVLAICALFAAPALATTVRDARIDATCEGYSITFFGEQFEPGLNEIIEVDYKITLAALTPGNDDVVVTGMTVLDGTDCVPVGDTCNVTVTESFTWEEALGFALPCGDYELLYGGVAPSCDEKPSFYRFLDIFGGTACKDPGPVDGWDGILECPCDEPGLEICRTIGFWGNRGGTEKKGSENITQAVIDAAMMPIEVCGEPINTTLVGEQDSALEAICVSPRGDSRLQLIRQLTAAALNCVATNGNGDCFEVSIGETFAACNDACIFEDEDAYGDCTDAVDCFNNGGILLDNGMCQIGTCADTGDACDEDEACGLDAMGHPIECLPLEGNCHDRPLVNADLGLDFSDPGPAGSPRACKSARHNDCTLLSCDEEPAGPTKGGKGDKGGKGKGKGKGGRR